MIEALIRNGDRGMHLQLDLCEDSVEILMRWIPPAPEFGPLDREEIRLPYPLAMALVGEPGGRSAAAAQDALGWRRIPEPLASLGGGLQSDCIVTVSSAERTVLRRWCAGDRGWLALGMDGEFVQLIPNSRDDIARALTSALLQVETDASDG